MDFTQLFTPCLILDRERMTRNIERMAARSRELGVPLRPHVKTPKAHDIVAALQREGAAGFTASTLQEAEHLFEGGFDNLFYAVPLDSHKVARAAASLRAGRRLSFLTDSLAAAKGCAAAAEREGVVLPFWVEIDVDHYRTGIEIEDADFLPLVRFLSSHSGTRFEGLMSYGGASYNASPAEAAELAERHRQALLTGKARIEESGLECRALSFGSTPAVLHAATMEGMSELRCGIYVFQDLFQAGIGACAIDDIAVSVLATVIGAHPGLNRFVIDAGGLALSKDRSTQGRPFDAGFGLICDARTGALVPDLYVSTVSQELGLVTTRSGAAVPFELFPVGSRLRILPNHADMTAAAYEEYHLLDRSGQVEAVWSRTNRW